jgi:hypothetical protein
MPVSPGGMRGGLSNGGGASAFRWDVLPAGWLRQMPQTRHDGWPAGSATRWLTPFSRSDWPWVRLMVDRAVAVLFLRASGITGRQSFGG